MMYGIYRLALQNEIYIDDLSFKETKLNEIVSYAVIRPYKTNHLIKKYPNLFRCIFAFFRFTWLFWNACVQTLVFLKFLVSYISKSKHGIVASSLVLYATPRLTDQLAKVKGSIPNKGLLIGKSGNYKPEIDCLSLSEVAKFADIFRAYKQALLAPIKLRKALPGNHIIQTYTAFEWFLTYNYLSRNQQITEIWFGNHCDRWAVLFDNLKIDKKVIVQHGIENGTLNPPVKLEHINKIHLIKNSQRVYFKDKIVSSNFEINELENLIKFSPLFGIDKLRILIVGNSSLFSKEEEILIKELSKLNVHLALKAHPVLSKDFYTSLLKTQKFTLIAERDIFPEVDIVISYESTLGVEYEIEGISVWYYSKYTIDEIINMAKDQSHTRAKLN